MAENNRSEIEMQSMPESRPKLTRTGRKKSRFRVPPYPAPSVRALWKSASLEQQARAHELSMAVLEYWLGKTTKGEIARRLNVPPLRVWQLSQLALSGMLAGLLRQPKARLRGSQHVALEPEDDPKILRQRILALERKLLRTEDLVRVLKALPWAPKSSEPQEESRATQQRIIAAQPPRKRRGHSVSPRTKATDGSGAADHAARNEAPSRQSDGREPALDP
jgi:hypothetical protein